MLHPCLIVEEGLISKRSLGHQEITLGLVSHIEVLMSRTMNLQPNEVTDGLSAVLANALRTGADQCPTVMHGEEVRKLKCRSPSYLPSRLVLVFGNVEAHLGNGKTVDIPIS